MGNLWHWLVPNRTDGILLIGTIVVVLGFVFHSFTLLIGIQQGYIEELYILFLLPVAFVAVACGACLGWWNFGRWRLMFLMVLATFGFLLPLTIEPVIGHGLLENKFAMSWPYQFDATLINGSLANNAIWMCGFVALAFIVSLVLLLSLRFVPKWCAKLFHGMRHNVNSRFELSRIRVITMIAIFLFVIAMVNNALLANGINVFRREVSGVADALQVIVAFGFGLIAFAAIIFWPSWSLLKGERLWIRFSGMATVLIPTILYCIVREFRSGIEWSFGIELAAIVSVSIVFLATVWCLGKIDGRPIYPSLWSLLIGSLGVLILGSPQFVDYSQFVLPRRTRAVAFADQVKFALESGRLKWKTQGQVSGADGCLFFNMTPESDPQILNLMDPNALRRNLVFSNMTPEIDTSLLQNSSVSSVTLIGGEIDVDQLKDMAGAAMNLTFQNVDLADSQRQISLTTTGPIQFVGNQSGGLAKFLSKVDQWKSRFGINIYTRISDSDWPEIVRISQSCPVTLYGGLPIRFTSFRDVPKNMSTKNITVNLDVHYSKREIESSHLQLVLDSDVKIAPNSLYNNRQLFWDLVFASPGKVDLNSIRWLNQNINEGARKITDSWDDYHWVFGKDANGNVTDLYLPGGNEIQTIPSAKTISRLSYDPLWLMDGDTGTINSSVFNAFGPIAKLVNLEELYFPDCQVKNPDLNFLLKLKKLRILQIPAIRRAPGSIGFDVGSSLEVVKFLGKPDKQSIIELGRLPRLKKVVISDVLNELSDLEKTSVRLANALPGIEIDVVPFGQHKSMIPLDFIEHLQKTRKKVRQKYSESSMDENN